MATPDHTYPNLFDLTGRIALISGATTHYGAAMATALAEAGAQIVAAGHDCDAAQRFASALPNNCGQAMHCGVELDHMCAKSIEQCVNGVIRRYGCIDILLNNALYPIAHDWASITDEQFSRHLANATGGFLLARHVRNNAVSRGKSASIIMIGSIYGMVASYPDAYEGICPANSAAYQTMKGGVIQLTRHLAVHWARDRIRVNCISPGPFPAADVSPQLVERLAAKSPIGRMGNPNELKGVTLLLASDAGSYITGQNITVDGGWTSW